MGKHETGYARIERDHYPTPVWVIAALAEHVDFRGLTVWEPACGDGRMVEALLGLAGCSRVYATDIANGYARQDEILDFLSGLAPKLLPRSPDGIVTNPPLGTRGKTAEAFIDAGLRQIAGGGFLALLLPNDFDSAKTRSRFFGDCPHFIGKVTLTRRVKWFNHPDKPDRNPKENHAWCLWARDALRVHRQPIILYAPS
jgi:hypothetical protein